VGQRRRGTTHRVRAAHYVHRRRVDAGEILVVDGAESLELVGLLFEVLRRRGLVELEAAHG